MFWSTKCRVSMLWASSARWWKTRWCLLEVRQAVTRREDDKNSFGPVPLSHPLGVGHHFMKPSLALVCIWTRLRTMPPPQANSPGYRSLSFLSVTLASAFNWYGEFEPVARVRRNTWLSAACLA
ncbi:hypothetical protein N657DRAFT_251648 [Parathielavia appendiculata]|uniref:Uncharacterized protein n=1 Tax=Parathielavia appendiculata TaxID=2587402 RepID=A0AAN6TRZ8_9PEZI|nr:hypothetical protein N657DRAFT_251648 [Parathielavia appendiculata]